MTQISTRIHIYYHDLDELTHLVLASRRESCYTHTVTQSRRAMYDDYDLDYTFGHDASYDLEEYQDLDEEYTREGQDYETLAYRHYA